MGSFGAPLSVSVAYRMRLRAAHRRGSTSARAAPSAASMQVPRSINALCLARRFWQLQRVKICVEPSLKAVVALCSERQGRRRQDLAHTKALAFFRKSCARCCVVSHTCLASRACLLDESAFWCGPRTTDEPVARNLCLCFACRRARGCIFCSNPIFSLPPTTSRRCPRLRRGAR